MQYYANGGGVQTTAGNAPPTSSSWQHFVFVVDSAAPSTTVYVDGVLWGNQVHDNPQDPHPFSQYTVGGFNPTAASAENFNGLIDEVALYDLTGVADLAAKGQELANHVIPEPSTVVLSLVGFVLIAWRRRK